MARMRKSVRAIVALVFAMGTASAGAQTVERDVKITGPRGRSIERSITTERGPGFVDRQISIQRPGGTFQSNVMVQRPMPAPGSRYLAGGGFVRPNFFVQRNVFVEPVAVAPPLFGGLFFGSLFAPPPPVIVTPPPVVIAGNATAPPPVVVQADPLAVELQRLKSIHSNNRRDGCIALGRLGDPRAVPSLIDRLKNDMSKDVRMAAAWGLAEIGDPAAAVSLEAAALSDRRHEVREAAAIAYKRLPKEVKETGRTETPRATAKAQPSQPHGARLQASKPPVASPPRTTVTRSPSAGAPELSDTPPPLPEPPADITPSQSPFAPGRGVSPDR